MNMHRRHTDERRRRMDEFRRSLYAEFAGPPNSAYFLLSLLIFNFLAPTPHEGGWLIYLVSFLFRQVDMTVILLIGYMIIHFVRIGYFFQYNERSRSYLVPQREKTVGRGVAEQVRQGADGQTEGQVHGLGEDPSDEVYEQAQHLTPAQFVDLIEYLRKGFTEDVVIDPAGDVTLVVFPLPHDTSASAGLGIMEPRQFRVSSQQLISRSSIFKTRLSPSWLRKMMPSPKDTRIHAITSTDPDTLSTLLNLLHGRPREMPRLVTLDQFTTLAFQAREFECEKVLQQPFLQRWLLDHFSEKGCSSTIDARWLFVAWMYRDAELFKKVTRIF